MIPAIAALEAGWCTFQVADGLYGLDVARVHEVLRPQPLTRVPLAPAPVVGLLNLRGQIVPAVDLRTLFGLAPFDSPGGLVVVRSPEGLVALVVDVIGDVRRPEGARVPLEHGDGDPFRTCTVPLADRLLTVLDVDRLLELAFDRAGREPLARSRPVVRRLPGD